MNCSARTAALCRSISATCADSARPSRRAPAFHTLTTPSAMPPVKRPPLPAPLPIPQPREPKRVAVLTLQGGNVRGSSLPTMCRGARHCSHHERTWQRRRRTVRTKTGQHLPGTDPLHNHQSRHRRLPAPRKSAASWTAGSIGIMCHAPCRPWWRQQGVSNAIATATRPQPRHDHPVASLPPWPTTQSGAFPTLQRNCFWLMDRLE